MKPYVPAISTVVSLAASAALFVSSAAQATGLGNLTYTPAGALALPGVNGGDYDNAAWMLSWSWPYLYAGGTGNGVYIVDATDPAKATLLRRITTGELGNFRVGPVYAAGNYIVPIGMD